MSLPPGITYSALPLRPPLRWPNEARVALWIVVNIEHFEFGSLGPALQPHLTSLPEIANYGWRDYGNRVGIWRMLEVFDRLPQLAVTAALNADICQYYPPIIEAIKQRGWEMLAHGLNNSTAQAGLDRIDERRLIYQTLTTIEAGTGQRPVGWLTPGFSVTERTPALLAEAGLEYLADWVNDDQPYWYEVDDGQRLVAVPYSLETNDITLCLNARYTGPQFVQAVKDQFDALYQDGATTGRVMTLALHPFIMGQPLRIRYLQEALEYLAGQPGVWFAQGRQISQWFKSGATGAY